MVKRSLSFGQSSARNLGPLAGGRRLRKKVPPGLLRAVAAPDALRGFGHYFEAGTCGDAGYQSSKEVDQIHDFWSHEWSSPRWIKTLSLLLFYNGVTSLVAILVLSLDLMGLLGSGFRVEESLLLAGVAVKASHPLHVTALCPIVFVMVLLFWQHVLQVMPGQGLARHVFLDKLCIPQTDVAKKEAAILSLAGYLDSSQRMVILWSPDYLTRLWCVYEVASWSYLGRDFRHGAVLLPMNLMVSLLFSAFGIFLFSLTVMLLTPRLEATTALIIQAGLIIVLGFIAAPFLRRIVRDLGHLEQQFKDFKVENASCFCCSAGHTQEDGSKMLCDRELIYKAIEEWFPAEEEEEEQGADADHLSRFNVYIQEVVAQAVSGQLWRPWSRYKMCLFLSIGVLWMQSARLSSFQQVQKQAGTSAAVILAMDVLKTFIGSPGQVMCIVHCCSVAARFEKGGTIFGVHSLLISACMIAATLGGVALIQAPVVLTRGIESPLPFSLASVLTAGFACFLFCWPLRFAR